MLFNLINLNMQKSLLEHIDNKTNKLTNLGYKNQNYGGKNCGIISYWSTYSNAVECEYFQNSQ